MTKSLAISSAFACALLGGCAPQPGVAPQSAMSSGRQCFNARQASNFIAHGDDIVDVQAGVRRYYRLQLIGVCPHINWSNRVALVSRGSSWICQGLDAEIIVNDPGLGPQRCLASSVRRLTDAEARALRYYR